ncbi:hypothetical protein BTA51_20580 [Hahella sp. CCB-MM4]|uniref:DUF4852 domain-containing protein n=1 Tax=Hahella sp. (strain CCB-MM4) TaxID=1926491 RepID=UPI000B9A613D|nr:DUF4852 domain-containing protein [Hahella sp. CCB-MM4]OZG71350.1 hypothetical protein BTA51_20580 [Hahella sp. CCB-MM4]
MVIRELVLLLLIVSLSACTMNGHHTYVNGKCISCWNDIVTRDTLDYETPGANNYRQLTWHPMMLEWLSNQPGNDMSPYGEDYLKSRIGLKAVSLRNNEITYQKEIQRSAGLLADDLSRHSLKPTYQITISSELGKYDVKQHGFPVRHKKVIELKGNNSMINLPKRINVNITNYDQLPMLSMDLNEAERFLGARNNGRWLYLRYIIEVEGGSSIPEFNGRVKEVQFINVSPSIVTREKKEEYAPMQIYTL